MGNKNQGCQTLVKVCANLKPGEKALIISDETTRDIGEAICDVAKRVTSSVNHHILSPFTMHGQEPPPNVAEEMLECSVIFGVTSMSMAHTNARLKASQNGVRYLSLPDYNSNVLASEALQVNFRALSEIADRIADILTTGHEIIMSTELGTSLTCNISGRTANSAPGWCDGPGTLASPPDAETNIAPLEDGSQGILVIDGSIPCKELGLLVSPLTLTIENGKIVTVTGKKAKELEAVLDHIGDPATRVLAEFGIGLNPKAKLCGSMLEDEGCLGTVHAGFGSNATIGGNNQVPFHLDMITRNVVIEVDGIPLMDKGQLLL